MRTVAPLHFWCNVSVLDRLPDSLRGLVVDARLCRGRILPDLSAFDTLPLPMTNLVCSLNLDSEFRDNLTPLTPLDTAPFENRTGVTVQLRGIAQPRNAGLILARPEQANPRHVVIGAHPCVIGDWFAAHGLTDFEIYQDAETYPTLKQSFRVQALAHFALADIDFLAGTPEFAETITDLFKAKKLVMGRRLVARASGHKDARSGSVSLKPWIVRIGPYRYRLTLEVVDTAGLHGPASYAQLLSNVGIKSDAKDTITRIGPHADILRMDEIYNERPEEFDAYAKGDLYTSDIIYGNNALWLDVWKSLGVGHRFKGTKLTVGACVADLIKARIYEMIGATDDDKHRVTDLTTGTHNASYLARLAKDKSPGALLSKVDGGRCRNAKPTTIKLDGALVDIDMSGAYANAMTATPSVFGKPRLVEYGNNRDKAVNLRDCPTLAEWLRTHEHRSIDRTWYMRINTREPLSFEFDLIASWIDWRISSKKSDSENVALDIYTDVASGHMRYFTREIWAGSLTSDLLDVARCTMSPAHYDEFSKKVVVRAALYYNDNDRLEIPAFAELFQQDALPEFAWTNTTVGALVSDVALANRKQHTKGTPLNNLYKLVSNTTYGDSVSRHFKTSSVIAGSNITGTVRAFMYLAEKGLNLVGSITDGQLFDLNKVLHPRTMPDKRRPHLAGDRRPADCAIETRAYKLSDREYSLKAKATLAPLIGSQVATGYNGTAPELAITRDTGQVETIVAKTHDKASPLYDDSAPDVALECIDTAAFEHLRRLWPKCKLLAQTFPVVSRLGEGGAVEYKQRQGLFRFESKAFVSRAIMHGSANYHHIATDPHLQKGPKMRSFEGAKPHFAFSVDSQGQLIDLNTYEGQSPATILFAAIDANPQRVPILPPFVKTRILKPGVYQANPKSEWESSPKYTAPGVVIVPGDSIYVMGRPRLFSLAQFTFQTRAQYDSWRKASTRLINKSGLAFEQWFTVDDGSAVDFTAMVNAIDNAIVAGVANPINHFNARYTRRLASSVVAMHNATLKMRDHLGDRLGDDSADYQAYDDSESTSGFSGGDYE